MIFYGIFFKPFCDKGITILIRIINFGLKWDEVVVFVQVLHQNLEYKEKFQKRKSEGTLSKGEKSGHWTTKLYFQHLNYRVG